MSPRPILTIFTYKRMEHYQPSNRSSCLSFSRIGYRLLQDRYRLHAPSPLPAQQRVCKDSKYMATLDQLTTPCRKITASTARGRNICIGHTLRINGPLVSICWLPMQLCYSQTCRSGSARFRDRKSTRLNSSHYLQSRMPSSA